MNLEFSEEQTLLREHLRRFLEKECPSSRVRRAVDGSGGPDLALWRGLGGLGYIGIGWPSAAPAEGGYVEQCVVAEELGRVLAPVPSVASSYLAAECLIAEGTEEQKSRWLPRLAEGRAIGCVALPDGRSRRSAAHEDLQARGDRVSGRLLGVSAASVADFAIVAAHESGDPHESEPSLFIVDLSGEGVKRAAVSSIDPAFGPALLDLDRAPAQPLGAPGRARAVLERVRCRAAVLVAFEQLGGADRALEIARQYALNRHAFGRQIGSFQAIKRLLVDMYVAATLARSNCYFAAWALAADAPDLPAAAAIAHASATEAFRRCARDAIQVHGAVGFTWEADCHLYYRRANALALALGSPFEWEERVVAAALHGEAA